LKLHDALSGAGLAALGGVVLWHIQGFPAMPGQKFGPAWFPGLIAAGLVLCGAILIVQGLRHAGTTQPWITLPAWYRKPRPVAGVVSVLGGLLFYVFAADSLGFHITGILLLTAWSRLLGASWRLSISVAVVATLVIHLSFYKLLRIPLPWGIFERFAF
jgi:putative tricarboxylic transport membrane protein